VFSGIWSLYSRRSAAIGMLDADADPPQADQSNQVPNWMKGRCHTG
jgi:hypothetical protein